MRQIMLLFMFAVICAGMPVAHGADGGGKEPSPKNDFWSTFGVGLAVTANLGRERSIQEAQLVNGIVRVTNERQVTPRLMLEKHWYLDEGWKEDGCHCRHGVFVGASLLGDKQMMDAVALGYLAGFKSGSKSDTTTHNLGIGLALQPYSRVLGDGLTKNQPLPAGETTVRYKETNRTALILFYTYTP